MSERIVDGRKMKRRIARRESPLNPELLNMLGAFVAGPLTISFDDPRVPAGVVEGVLVLVERTAGMNTRRIPQRIPRASLIVSLELIMEKYSRKTSSWPFSH
ncbi:MAG TPA: hypothetical protein VFE98_03345 [Candidatus Bathyarchaeia archaeon]|nr:hypothetical protein [Candidatus Bathyarchaeia archaeon]